MLLRDLIENVHCRLWGLVKKILAWQQPNWKLDWICCIRYGQMLTGEDSMASTIQCFRCAQLHAPYFSNLLVQETPSVTCLEVPIDCHGSVATLMAGWQDETCDTYFCCCHTFCSIWSKMRLTNSTSRTRLCTSTPPTNWYLGCCCCLNGIVFIGINWI